MFQHRCLTNFGGGRAGYTVTILVDMESFFRRTTGNLRATILGVFKDWTRYFDIVLNPAAIYSPTVLEYSEVHEIKQLSVGNSIDAAEMLRLGEMWLRDSQLIWILRNNFPNFNKVVDVKINADIPGREVMLLTFNHGTLK